MVKGLPDATRVLFDDERAVANAGVMLPAVLAGRLGIEALVEEMVDLGDRAGAANPGRKVMSLVSAMALGADCIDDCDVLRSGETEAVLGHGVAAPSTLGTFLRAFTFGHVRQLDRVLAESLSRAWMAGAGPGDGQLVVDVDSFVGEVYGYDKQGAGYGYTHKRGYHPILATRAGTGEVLHIRARKGSANTSRGALRFVEELIPRVQRAGASGPKLLRADSGFWNHKIMDRLQAAGWSYTIGVRQQKHVKAAITAIPEQDWRERHKVCVRRDRKRRACLQPSRRRLIVSELVLIWVAPGASPWASPRRLGGRCLGDGRGRGSAMSGSRRPWSSGGWIGWSLAWMSSSAQSWSTGCWSRWATSTVSCPRRSAIGWWTG
ncbi:IS1380 family transposase [Conexibacter sp. DBS9H8]|uniref:IS1380 family transposase n=1 Tax=Conexibacter sp. DBS9H8 TaxID=2937801 RepID=UPI002112B6CA|nr:IS1380 family transposase [Conexibacter sp. DBS9H8]